jgi:hypothetical protein
MTDENEIYVGSNEPEPATVLTSTKKTDFIGYPITLKKFILLNLFTFSLFQLVWAYKSFRRLNGPGASAAAASGVFAWFLPLSLHSLMKKYEQASAEAGQPIKFHKVPIALLYFVLVVSSNYIDRIKSLPPGIGLVETVLAVVLLGYVQNKVNKLNSALYPGEPFAEKYTWKHWLGIVCGVVILIAIIGAAAVLQRPH